MICFYKERLATWEATRYRALAARLNYLAADRPDLQYAVKCACQCMSDPTWGGWKQLKRIGRYLRGQPRLVMHYPWQKETKDVTVYSDSDWAGCKETAKSTSGGVVMQGRHLLKSWSSTQRTVALSSGEAELTAMVKATCEGLGVRSLLREWGQEVALEVYGDSNGALGIVKRRGAGKLRHMRIGNLWLQDMREQEEVSFQKILGRETRPMGELRE